MRFIFWLDNPRLFEKRGCSRFLPHHLSIWVCLLANQLFGWTQCRTDDFNLNDSFSSNLILVQGLEESFFIDSVGWRLNKQFCFSKSVPFRILTPIASFCAIFAATWSSNGRLQAIISRWLAQGHKSLTANRWSFCFAFLRHMRYFVPLTIPLS